MRDSAPDTKPGKPSFDLRTMLAAVAESFIALRTRATAWRPSDSKASEAPQAPAALPSPPPDARARLRSLVLEGKDGYLFHHDQQAVQQVTGVLPFAPTQLEQWVSTTETRKAWCDARGIVSRFLVVPEKHVVYADKLPDGISISEQRPAAMLIGAAGPGLSDHILYPLEPLRQARQSHETHYVTDTHWSSFGAYVAYKDLMTSLARDIELVQLEESDLAWSKQRYVGDLGVRLEPERFEIAEELLRGHSTTCKLTLQNRKFERGNLLVFENERNDLPSCVLFRDSFAHLLLPLLFESFSRLVAVSSLSVLYDLLRAERPDVVIVQVAERFLGPYWTPQGILMPEDSSGPRFADLTGIELEALRGS
jgi:alginate O-acetyltransferase complex protein AlgJ